MIIKMLLLLVSFWFCFALPAFCEEVTYGNVRSHCGFGNKKTMDELRRLNEWMRLTELSLSKLKTRRDAVILGKQTVLCAFSLSESGDISNVHIVKSSRSAKADEQAITLLKRANPLEPCSHALALQNGFLVEFVNSDPHITVSKEPNLSKEQKIKYFPPFDKQE